MDTITMAAVAIAIIALIIAVWALIQVRQTRHLRSKFGPEYDYEVERAGDRHRAEAELVRREDRVRKLHIRDLAPDTRRHYAEAWRSEQARFVDDPTGAVRAADVLVTEVMNERGYPTTAEASVDHPHVMGNYRQAHEIADRNRTGLASTEDLRRAMVCYRALFEELLGTSPVEEKHEEVRR